jgi:hypothetical protein
MSDDRNQALETGTTTLYRPTGPAEILLVQESGFLRWPPRLPHQPIFYPVTNLEYAEEIARNWNVPESGYGCVTRFSVTSSFMAQFELRCVGARRHMEWWVPAERLDELNSHIVGRIEVVSEFGARPAGLDLLHAPHPRQ